MSDALPPNPETRKSDNKDITPLLQGWEYESGSITVRRILGQDGRPKLQMRLDLGLLQMEMSGRPDGLQPHGVESLLDYHERQLESHIIANGTELGFSLSRGQCQSLREEAVMYYHRYLGLFVLGEFAGVVRDTSRNLRLLDLCGKYAVDEQDRYVLEQYRPYITMMNTRAAASIDFRAKRYQKSLEIVNEGLANLKEFFRKFGQTKAYQHSSEVRILRRLAQDIKKRLPIDPVADLRRRLDRAIKREHYEQAAKLRDELLELERRQMCDDPLLNDQPST